MFDDFTDVDLEKHISWLSTCARSAGIFDNGPSCADALARARDELARRRRRGLDSAHSGDDESTESNRRTTK